MQSIVGLSHLGQLFFLEKKRAVLGVVDLFVVPLAFYLVVNMYWMVWLGLVSSMT